MDEETDLRAQIAALTAAVQALGAKVPKAQPITFAELAAKYGRKVGKKYIYTLKPFLRRFGDRVVSTFRRAEYLEWRDEERAHATTMLGTIVSIGTLNQELKIALAMCRWGVEAEHLDENPIEGIAALKGQCARETEIDPAEDAKALAGAPLIVRVFQGLCDETGARNGCEVRLVEWSHIDKARAVVKFPRENTKGKVMTREVPISRELLALIEEMPVMLGNPYLFPSPLKKGRPYSYVGLHRLWRPYLDKLTPAPGDGRVVTHDRRHGRVSRLARAGINPMAAMKLIGHKTPAMHWRYLHVSEADREAMRAVLEQERRGPLASPPVDSDGKSVTKR